MRFPVRAPRNADVSGRRAASQHRSMFLRMLMRAALLRKGRAVAAVLAMVVAAAVATAVMNLYVDVEAKLHSEFRQYGANLVAVAKDGGALPASALLAAESELAGRGLAVPFAYVIARTADGQSVVVAGTDFERLRALNRWWSVTSWPSAPHQALVGTRAAALVSRQGKPFDLRFQGRTVHLTPAGTFDTGSAEDSRVYLALPEFVAWTGVKPSTIEVAATGSPQEVTATIERLRQALAGAEVRPVRQILESEARVLGKTRATLLASAVLIILTAALCVLATLIGWVFDRRRDFAIMKALGGSDRLLNAFFAAEAAVLGLVGALLGYLVGIAVAAWIGRVNFHAPVVPRLSVLPWVLVGSVAVALLSAVVPIGVLRRVQPAAILRGE